jgi:phospholipid/cholesterol/gamma-HCH transport system substrate-binding protein
MTGIVAIGSLLGLIIMLMLFGELNLTERFYNFKVHVTNAGGLTGTSSVTLNGVKVGKVLSTDVVPPPGSGAALSVQVKQGVGIPTAAKVSIERSFVGEASLEFTIPPDAPATAMKDLIKPGADFEAGEPSSMLTRLASSIEKPLARFEVTAQNIDRLAETYNTVGERINELLEPRTVADVKAGKPANIRSTIARADDALAGAGSLLGDQEVVSKTKGLIDKASRVLDQATDLATAWKNTAGNLDTQVTKVSADVDSLATQATSALRNTDKAAGELAGILESVGKGQGTVGQLVQNPDLYNSLRDASQRLEKALAQVQLLVEKYKTEGLPLRF